MWGNTVAIYSVLKKKNYGAKFSTSSIWKNKIDKDNFEKKTKKNHKKTMWGNTVAIHIVFFLKKLQN
jgi:hypothetical protein